MKKRAILFLVSVVFLLFGINSRTVLCQDTIATGSFPSTESFKTMTEGWKIMEQAFKEQFKALDLNTDSLKYYLELLNEQIKNLPDPMVIPDDIAKSFGNNFDRNVYTTTVNLKGESKIKEVVVNVEEKIPVMFLIINGGVKSGIISVEIYDPNGKKQGGFSIESDDSKNGEIVNGSINKSLKKPMIGNWKIRVDSDKAIGNVFITSMQKL